MKHLSTRQAAKMLGLSHAALVRYIAAGKIPSPESVEFGGFRAHTWTEAQVEEVRKLLPKIANGRKTRYQKKQSAVSKQQPARENPKRPKPKKKK